MSVSRLMRIRYGSMGLLRHLLRGGWRDATEGELAALMAAAGMQVAANTIAPERARGPTLSRHMH